MADVPEVLDPSGAGELKGVPRITKKYLDIPEDEVPIPGTSEPVKKAEHVISRIFIELDQRPLIHEINEAVQANDMGKVLHLLRGARIEAEQASATLVKARIVPPK